MGKSSELNNKYHAFRLPQVTTLLISLFDTLKSIINHFQFFQIYGMFSALLFILSSPFKTGIFSISWMACQLNAR